MDSKHKSDYGEWKLTAGKFYGDAEKDKGWHLFICMYFLENALEACCICNDLMSRFFLRSVPVFVCFPCLFIYCSVSMRVI